MADNFVFAGLDSNLSRIANELSSINRTLTDISSELKELNRKMDNNQNPNAPQND